MYYYFSNKIEGHLSGRSHISWMDSGAAFVWLNDVLHGKSAKRSFFAELCFTWKISGPAIFFWGGEGLISRLPRKIIVRKRLKKG